MAELDIFEGFTKRDLHNFYLHYLEDVYIDPSTEVISPGLPCNGFYFIIGGHINVHYNFRS